MSSEYIFTDDTPVVELSAEIAFNSLTDEEKEYAHYLSKSSWFGSLIVLFQTSSESPLILTLIRLLFKNQTIDELKELAQRVAKFDEKDWRSLLVYFAAFLANLGNYRGFGDSKFIPDLDQNKFETLVVNSNAYKKNQSRIKFIWDNIKDKLYSLHSNEVALGFSPNGTNTYSSKNFTEEDSKLVKQFLENNKIEAYNTRVFKDEKSNTFEIRFASILSTEDNNDSECLQIEPKEQTINGKKFVLSRGDYSSLLVVLNKYLFEAQKKARNETQKKMIGEYISHFRTGSLKSHKEGSRYWIKDKSPIVETYIGFIENYRDPAGMRAEFEGFVAMVNKEMSKKFTTLVEKASNLLPLLPWPKMFEMDKFLEPDFTSLDVLTFAGSGIPAGINIPNYDEIRQNEGFKNVSLGNVITAALKESQPNYLSPEDASLLQRYAVASFEVQVALHELLGHGSGKMFKMDEQKLNFDINATINPLTNHKIDKWYKNGETYDSKFTTLGSAYEECRAECVGLYLSLEPSILDVFGLKGEDANQVIYVNWLSMVYSGIESLKMYNPSVKKWLQSHSQARYVITRVLLESSKQLLNIEYIEKSATDGNADLLITLKNDLNLISTVGKKAIGDFLLKLQVYKSMGDIESAQQLFDKYSEVSDDLEHPFLRFRQIVLSRKKPRKLFIESSTHLIDGKVVLKSYEPTHEGMIQSFIDHFDSEDNIEDIIIELWKKDINHFV